MISVPERLHEEERLGGLQAKNDVDLVYEGGLFLPYSLSAMTSVGLTGAHTNDGDC